MEVDEGDGDLAPLRVVLAADTGFEDGGVGEQGGLDLGGIDIFAAGDDQVVAAVEDVEVAFGIEVADVAGGEPAIVDGGGGSVGTMVIAGGDAGTFEVDGAGRIRWKDGAEGGRGGVWHNDISFTRGVVMGSVVLHDADLELDEGATG